MEGKARTIGEGENVEEEGKEQKLKSFQGHITVYHLPFIFDATPGKALF